MIETRLLAAVITCVSAIFSASSYADVITYKFSGTVTDGGNVAGVSASIGEAIILEFAYDTSTSGSPDIYDPSLVGYRDFTSPLIITLPS